MKYSVAILLALFGLTAASILQRRDGSLGHSHIRNYYNKHNSNYNNYNDNNNYNNKNINNNNNNGQVTQHLVQKQKTVLQLLTNLQQKNIYQNLAQLGNNFNPNQILNQFNNQVAVKKFLKNYQNNNFLPLNEVFSPTNQQHQNQAAQLFTFLYSAQDWTTLKQAAAWARDRFNTEQFAYVFSAVVLNHPTTQGVVIPALYEIIPTAFVPITALHKIYNAKVQGAQGVTVHATYSNQNRNNNNYNNNNGNNQNNNYNNNNNDDNNNNVGGTHNPINIFADNDGSQINNAGTTENPENRISYFTEDVGINDLQARFHIQNPAFLGLNNNNNYFTSNTNNGNNNGNNNNNLNNNKVIRRGEAFYFAHQQLYARYVLERLSNNLPIPHPINLNDKIETGYNPNLQHINGQAVPARPPNTQFQQQQVEDNNNNNNALQPNNNQAQNAQVYETRLQQAVESGFVLNQDGTKTQLNNQNGVGILANLIAAPANSLNPAYYGDYFNTAKNAIGNIVDPNNQNLVAPGAVSNIATAARDPAYYQLLAKLNQIFNNLQNKLGPYTQSQIAFPGVKIQNLDVSNLVTYFETFNVNVNNAIPQNLNNNNNNNYNNDNNNYDNDNTNNNNNYNNDNNNNNNYNDNNNNNNYNNDNNNNNDYINNDNSNNNNYNNDNSNNNNNYDNNNNNNNYNNDNNNYDNNNNNNYDNNNNNNNDDDINNNNNNGINNGNNVGNFNVKFQRLANKPFNVKLTVQSNVNTNAIVRLFIGPKYDSNGQLFTLPQASQYFVQLDQFKVTLHNGLNTIQRNSQQSNVNVNDALTINQLWNRVQSAQQGQQTFTVNKNENQVVGLPIRAQIPKGKVNGQQFVLYAIINNVNNNNNDDINNNDNYNNNNNDNMSNGDSLEVLNYRYNNNNNNNNNNNDYVNDNNQINNNNQINQNVVDNRSVGFPLDRPVLDSNFNTANQYFKTVTIYHHLNNNNNN